MEGLKTTMDHAYFGVCHDFSFTLENFSGGFTSDVLWYTGQLRSVIAHHCAVAATVNLWRMILVLYQNI